jgi:hypothetical protein
MIPPVITYLTPLAPPLQLERGLGGEVKWSVNQIYQIPHYAITPIPKVVMESIELNKKYLNNSA